MEGTVRRKLTFLFYVGMIFFLKRGRAGQWKGGGHTTLFSPHLERVMQMGKQGAESTQVMVDGRILLSVCVEFYVYAVKGYSSGIVSWQFCIVRICGLCGMYILRPMIPSQEIWFSIFCVSFGYQGSCHSGRVEADPVK